MTGNKEDEAEDWGNLYPTTTQGKGAALMPKNQKLLHVLVTIEGSFKPLLQAMLTAAR